MKIIAHRGDSSAAPENTLEAIRIAVGQKADGVEFDVRMTQDGVPALLHDEDLERTAGVSRLLKALRSNELGEIDVGRLKHPRFKGTRIPLLAQALDEIPEWMTALIELKEGPETVEPVLRVLAEAPHRNQAQNVFMSFNRDTTLELRKQARESIVLGLVPPPQGSPFSLSQMAEMARQAQLDGLGISDQWMERLQEGTLLHRSIFGISAEPSLLLSVWTVNHPGRARVWRKLGAAFLTTDNPGSMKAALESTQPQ